MLNKCRRFVAILQINFVPDGRVKTAWTKSTEKTKMCFPCQSFVVKVKPLFLPLTTASEVAADVMACADKFKKNLYYHTIFGLDVSRRQFRFCLLVWKGPLYLQ